MYKEYFHLREMPFSLAPDPRFFYVSVKHREALAHLVYGITCDGGFILLTGEVGTGKTTVCRCLLDQIPDDTDVAFILNPKLTVTEMLITVCDELGISYPDGITGVKVYIDRINAHLLEAHARGRKTVLIIEEAQNLGADVLEQVRLLTNLETNTRKLLQVVMIGQPELRELLARPEMRQLSQRITARYHLVPLSRDEVANYVAHRLSVAGATDDLFPSKTITKLFEMSGGIPRLVNLLCDRALLGTYAQDRKVVDTETLLVASGEVFGKNDINRSRLGLLRQVIAVLLIALFAALSVALYQTHLRDPAGTPTVNDSLKNTLQWTSVMPVHLSRDIAYRNLFQQWGLHYEGDSRAACTFARGNGMDCLSDLANIGTLLGFNSPAVLRLFDRMGHEFYATLVSVGEDEMTFLVGDEKKFIRIMEFERSWFGDCVVMWKVPPGYRGIIRPGAQGDDVRWLSSQLRLIADQDVITTVDHIYGDELVRKVKQFQRSRGLVPDGIVGPRTIIHLSNVLGTTGPRLYSMSARSGNVVYP